MSTYTTTKFALTAANGDDPILNGDNQMRGLADTTETALANVIGSYKALGRAGAVLPGSTGAGTYLFTSAGSAPSLATASVVTVSGGTPAPFPLFYLDPADYTVGSRTTKYRLRATIGTNATATAITFTYGLYPVTFAGGAGVLTATLGTVTPGSTAAIASPATSSVVTANSGDFTAPSAGGYALGVVLSGGVPANSYALASVQLQMRQV